MNLFVLNCIPIIFVALFFIGNKESEEEFLSVTSSKALKGFAAIGVILHHLTQINTNYNQIWTGPINLWNEMGILFTGVFFFLSGYGLWTSFHTKPNYLQGFLKKRLSTVLIPFYVSNWIYVLIMGIGFGILTRPSEVLTSILGLTLVNTNMWYLVEIVLFYLAFYFLYKNTTEKQAEMGLIIVVGLVVGIGLFSGWDTTVYGWWFRGEWWYNTSFVFLYGMYFAKHKKETIRKMKNNYKKNLAINIVSWMILMAMDVLLLTNIGYHYQPSVFIGALCRLILCIVQTMNAIAFVRLLMLLSIQWKFENPFYLFIGEISLELYVIHNIVRLGCAYMLGMSNTLLYIVVLTVSILLSYPFYKLDRLFIRKVIQK